MAKKPQKSKELSRMDYVRAALVVAQSLPWDMVTLQDISDEAGGSLAQMREYFDDKTDILGAYGAHIDREMLSEVEQLDKNMSVRDKLFELMMIRFDVIENDRNAVVSIVRSLRSDPKSMLYSLPHLCRSMEWIFEGSGVQVNGIKGSAKIIGLTMVYLNTLRAWINEENPDLSDTMAALDKGLKQADSWAEKFNF